MRGQVLMTKVQEALTDLLTRLKVVRDAGTKRSSETPVAAGAARTESWTQPRNLVPSTAKLSCTSLR